MQQMTIAYLGSLIILSFATLLLVFKNANDKKQFKLMEFELEKYKVLEFSKDQLDKDYDIRLKQVEYDKAIENRDFMFNVAKEDRDYMLKMREIEMKERQNQNQLMEVIEQNKDVQFRIKK
jgi:hypothetical protein